MLSFLKKENSIGKRITSHLDCNAITDFVLKVINVQDLSDNADTLLVCSSFADR